MYYIDLNTSRVREAIVCQLNGVRLYETGANGLLRLLLIFSASASGFAFST